MQDVRVAVQLSHSINPFMCTHPSDLQKSVTILIHIASPQSACTTPVLSVRVSGGDKRSCHWGCSDPIWRQVLGLPCTCTASLARTFTCMCKANLLHLTLYAHNQSLARTLTLPCTYRCGLSQSQVCGRLHVQMPVWSHSDRNILCCVGRVFSADKEPRSKLVDRAWSCGGSNRDHASLASGAIGLSHFLCCCDCRCCSDCRCLYCCLCRCLCLCCCLSLLMSAFILPSLPLSCTIFISRPSIPSSCPLIPLPMPLLNSPCPDQ